ncbi:MAG: PocR ligand-binding domain-containing protein, partial [Bacteroidales bacterium]
MELTTIVAPEGDIRDLELSGLINIQDIQCMMDNFYKIAHIPMAIVDLKGSILVGVGFQEICTRFHRVHPETCKNCLESDLQLTTNIPKGEFRLYKCKNGMWDMATPIFVGDHCIGNLFIGQFFFRNESIDYQHFRSQALRYNFNMQEYIDALEKVPHLERENIEIAKIFFLRLADSFSQLSYSNYKLAISVKETRKLTDSLRRDIIERKKTEKMLAEKTHRLERSQEIAHLGSWELDLVTDTLTWSDEVYRIFGLSPGEFEATYEAFLEAVHPDDRDAVNTAYSSSLAENRSTYEIEHRILRKNGEVRFVHERCEHFSNKSGKIVKSVGMVHDITDYKKAEKELKESEDKLNIALEIGNIGSWEWDLRTDGLNIDSRLEEMLGFESGAFNGTYPDFENMLNEKDIAHFKNTISNALNKGVPVETIFRVNTNNNGEKYLNTKAIVDIDDSGDLVKMTGVCFDITEMKRGAENVLFK